jgi:hypothetical protein
MEPVHPVVGQDKLSKPDRDDRIVEGETAKQKLFYGTGIHNENAYFSIRTGDF